MPSIRELLEQNALRTRFQPIVSLNTRTIIGFEALSHALWQGERISPKELFDMAREEGSIVSLDRQCRENALRAFAASPWAGKALLFINFESSLVDLGVNGSGYFSWQCSQAGLPFSSVVIEVLESAVADDAALEAFVAAHRSQGFLVAVDDVGEGHSNLNRIALIKPDIIKGDRSLANGIDRDWTKQRIVSSLARLSNDLGALFLLEGIEREEELFCANALGCDVMQGYCLSYPDTIDSFDGQAIEGRVVSLVRSCRERAVERFHARSALLADSFSCVEELARHVCACAPEARIAALEAGRDAHPRLECLYMLDVRGIQAGPTVLSSRYPSTTRSPIVFHPALAGSDHSLKEYYYAAAIDQRRHATAPYLSLASGRPCMTLTVPLQYADSRAYLCADFALDDSACCMDADLR